MRVNPYLLFDGNCEEAFGAYAKIFGGKIVAMMPFEALRGKRRRRIGARRSCTPAWNSATMR
jgi:uncharacterized glyoxalase superfamily protein PhnB